MSFCAAHISRQTFPRLLSSSGLTGLPRPLCNLQRRSPSNRSCLPRRPLQTVTPLARPFATHQPLFQSVVLSKLIDFDKAPSPLLTTMADDVRGDMTLDEYEFPHARLRRRTVHGERTPLVLIACGSFSPITFLHLRMFEMAADYARFNTDFEVVGAYLSCVGDAYKKSGLVKAEHRINMCTLAVQQSPWISVDPWEALHSEYLETAKVLDHFDHEINEVIGGVETPSGKKKCRIALLAGADLIQTMSTPGVWSASDIDYILGNYGAFIVERTGTDVDEALSTLQQHRNNIHVIQQLVQNDISSTKIRLFRKRDMSIRYLVPEQVVTYIEMHDLYDEDGAASTASKVGKRLGEASSSTD